MHKYITFYDDMSDDITGILKIQPGGSNPSKTESGDRNIFTITTSLCHFRLLPTSPKQGQLPPAQLHVVVPGDGGFSGSGWCRNEISHLVTSIERVCQIGVVIV